MIQQTLSSVLVGCPVCGRRVKMRSQDVGRAVRCGHCQGKFALTEPANDVLDILNEESKEDHHDLADNENASQRDECEERQATFDWSNNRNNGSRRIVGSRASSLRDDGKAPRLQRAVLVEHRDKAFARIN